MWLRIDTSTPHTRNAGASSRAKPAEFEEGYLSEIKFKNMSVFKFLEGKYDTVFLSLFLLKSVSTCKNICFFNKFIYLNSQGMSSFQYKLTISGTFDGCYDSSHT